MNSKKISRFLSFVLAAFMTAGCLPLGVFAAETSTETSADYRGAMSADKNGVMVYDDLKPYLAKSAKDVLLKTDYYVDSAATSTSTNSTLDTRYPDLTVDWALYYDPSIAGTTVVVKQGLSEIDSVSYVDAEGNVTTGKSPKELTASNGGDESYGAGYGENAAGETTVHYKEKSVLFYLINHSCSERIGTESDVSILSDYIAEGYLVVVLDFKNSENAITPYIEQSLTEARALFTRGNGGNEVSDLTDSEGNAIATSIHFFYFLPEGCRLARDVWYFDPSIWGLNGLMEEHVAAWNKTFAGTSKDVLGIGKLTSVEDMITRLKQTNGDPIDYKHCMNIIYPSQPKDNYEAPVYLQEGSLPIKENNVHNSYTRGTYTGFALNGYAAIMYDHPFHPFLLDGQYFTPDNYGTFPSSYNNARAAVRCVRYYADTFGYDADLIGAAGISKATIGAAVLSVVGNEDLQGSVSGYNNQVSFGDIYEEGVANTEKTPDNRLKAIVQPFKTSADGETELDSEVTCTYCSSGFGIEMLFGRQTFANEQRVPMVISDGIRDPYNCYNYFDYLESWYDINVDTPYLLIPMLDQGHTYPVGYDDQYGYDRFEAMIKFFNVHLKPEENKAPEVLWITPTDNSTDVPVSGEWNSGPFTPVGWEMNSYDRIHKIQVKFLKPVTADSVNYGMVVTDGAGNRVGGTWVASEAETMYTFETNGLSAGTTYTITATKDIKSREGVALKEEKSVTFTTEGTYALRPAADTYVSISKPDAVYGEEKELLIDTDHIALLSYPAASVASASKITLSSLVSRDANTSVTVWAMPNIKVDEAALTYNLLTASDAWKQKVSLGSYEIASAELSLDLSGLSKVENLGNYVTLAIVSDETAIENAFVFEEDYEGYAADTVIDAGRNALHNSPYSEQYLVKLSGNYGAPYIVEMDGSNVIRFVANNVNTVRFYNMLKDGDLTADDIGKTYRISFRIKTELAGASYYGFMSATAGEGSSNSVGVFTGPVSPYSNAYCEGDRTAFTTEAGVWKDMCVYVTVTEAMVNTQAGMFTIQPPNYVESHYTWFDDFKVEEAKPRVTLLSSEGATNGRVSLVTTNSTAVEFPEGDLEGGSSWTDTSTPNVTAVTPAEDAEKVGLLDLLTVTFDKEMNVDSLKKGIVVTNETTGKTVGGTWKALDDTGMSFVFATNGFAANQSYCVAVTKDAKSLGGFPCVPETLTTFKTAESLAVRPLVSTYVSKVAPTQSYGLDLSPIIDASRVGVMTFSAASLLGASSATLYLPVSSSAATKITLSAIADYTPDESFCYNTLAGLSLTKIADAKIENGVVEIDVSALAALGAEKSVTLVIEMPAYSYEADFDAYAVGTVSADQANINKSFSGSLYRVVGNLSAVIATEDGSSVVKVTGHTKPLLKFYNVVKNAYLTADDVGKTFEITVKVKSETAMTLQYGLTNVHQSASTEEGAVDKEVPTGVPTWFWNGCESINLNANEWTTITYSVTLTEDHVKYELGTFAFRTGTNDSVTFYVDDLKSVEIVAEAKFDKNQIILGTVNDSISVRPTVSTYVSKREPTKSFGLDTLPKIDGINIGVMTFPVSVLTGATSVMLSLPVVASETATISLSAIADYTPDTSFSYNTLKGLSPSSLGEITLNNGVSTLDLAVLATLGAKECVTLVFEIPAYSYDVDFDDLTEGTTYADQSAVNKSFSGSLYRIAGNIGAPIATVDGSKVVAASGHTKPMLKFYNVVKDSYLTKDDIGKTFEISFKIKSDTAMTMQYGLTNVHHSASTEEGAVDKEVPSSVPTWFYHACESVTLAQNEWTTVTYTVTLTEDHVKYEWGTLGFRPGVSDQVTFYIDDLKSTEVVSEVRVQKGATLSVVSDYITVDPTVSTYVSVDEPEKANGLNTEVKVDGANIGILGFETKALADTPTAKLYLPVSVSAKASIEIYAIADYLPSASFCYNTLKGLTLTKLATVEAVNGTVAIDISTLSTLGAKESVTLVLKSGAYTYEDNFDSRSEGDTSADQAAVNKGFSNAVYRVAGNLSVYEFTSIDGSMALKFTGNNKPLPKLFNVITDDYLTTADIGRTFKITFRLMSDTTMSMQYGLINATADTASGEGKEAPTNPSWFWKGCESVGLTANTWTDVAYTVTLTEDHFKYELATLGFRPGDAASVTFYIDDLKTVEIVPTATVTDAKLAVEGDLVLELDETDRPVKDAELILPAIQSAQVGVGKDITVYYFATAEGEAPTMRFTVGGKSETVSGVKSGNQFVFAYKGIAPQGMGVAIKAELMENGEVVDTRDDYSVLAYCKALLQMSASELGMSAEKYAAMKTAVADMLAYGAAAQKYTGTNTDALVDEGIEGASSFTALDDSFKRLPSASTAQGFGFTAAGVYFDYTNHLYFKFNAVDITEDNFILRVTSGQKSTDYTLSDFDVLGTNKYRVMTSGIAALDFGTMYTVELIKVDGGENVVQTLEYGVSSYVYSMQNDADMAELAQRTYLYGVSAKAYADAE